MARNHLPVIVGGTNYYIQVGILIFESFYVHFCVSSFLQFIHLFYILHNNGLSHPFFLSLCLCGILFLLKVDLFEGAGCVLQFISCTDTLSCYALQALVSPFLLDDSTDDLNEIYLGDPPGKLL